MKRLITLMAAVVAAFTMNASDVQLVVEKVDNGGAVPGYTYRVYAQLPSVQHSLHAVFADDQDNLSVETTGSFYQNQYGNYSTIDINPGIIQADPALAYDSWITIGAENNQNNNLWAIGVEYDAFLQGGSLTIDDGAWFVVPTDVRAMPDSKNLILLMQLTTDGTSTGALNFQGWDADGGVWQARQVTFSTDNAQIFGCTDQGALNFNNEAEFDNGTCEYAEESSNDTPMNSLTAATDEAVITVFPNPVFEGQFNLQFSERLDLSKDNMIVDIFSMNGQKVLSQEISNGAVIGGNRVIVNHELATGTYTVNITIGEYNEAVQVIVQR